MQEAIAPQLAAWESFYVIVGSSAVALTGLPFVAAILSAPWHSLHSAGIGIGICSVAGLIYSLVVIGRARRQTGYQPVLEDWIWHTALPPVGYGAMAVAAGLLRRHPEESLFVIGGATVLLTFIGIHNAWDTVTFIAVAQQKKTP